MTMEDESSQNLGRKKNRSLEKHSRKIAAAATQMFLGGSCSKTKGSAKQQNQRYSPALRGKLKKQVEGWD